MLHAEIIASETWVTELSTTDMKSLRGLIQNLMYISKTRHLLYITDISQSRPSGRMEHLSCFFPGLIALGLHILPDSVYESTDEKLIFQYAAEGLTYTCWVLYADQATGVGPDIVTFGPYSTDEYNIDDWESGRWINHVNEWFDRGKPKGQLKGVHNLSPPRRGELDLPLDYEHHDTRYLMRPEVRLVGPSCGLDVGADADAADRRSSQCTSCGRPLATQYGENEGGRCSRMCKSTVPYRVAGWLRSMMSALPRKACETRCQGESRTLMTLGMPLMGRPLSSRAVTSSVCPLASFVYFLLTICVQLKRSSTTSYYFSMTTHGPSTRLYSTQRHTLSPYLSGLTRRYYGSRYQFDLPLSFPIDLSRVLVVVASSSCTICAPRRVLAELSTLLLIMGTIDTYDVKRLAYFSH